MAVNVIDSVTVVVSLGDIKERVTAIESMDLNETAAVIVSKDLIVDLLNLYETAA